ncbi:ornithine monooxygenase [Streptomyces sp. CB03234]|uniref:lysine N(6)-hydroxylase/L-ornithine N(5)-oxygenase family protein n=1 Tax=Streptomyces sp. (strain CB03234) TaxID=1703937 RepID=UPI0009398804|nr:SidA/IucD/PvdA family monooxygenase [Streptomyces sp. CB03234]OKK03489.1 ornithine monooxygenase [Streptomyces sp. CB03234]
MTTTPARAEQPAPYDVLGIGFGPANLALAIALQEENAGLSVSFLEAKPEVAWQSAMLLDGSDIQNNPIRDLVSLRNPRSRYSFVNYLHEEGRLLEFLNLPMEFPLRKEYTRYISWVARYFDDVVEYNVAATDIAIVPGDEGRNVYRVTGSDGVVRHAHALVLGPGRSAFVPEPFDRLQSPRVFHLTRYLPALDALREAAERGEGQWPPKEVAVIGGSQSAVELTLDLSRRFPDATVTTYVRPYGLRLKDTSPFSEEGYFPEFTQYYYQAPRHRKKALDEYMRLTNYSAADGDVLHELYALIYEQKLDGDQRVFVRGNRQTMAVQDGPDGVRLQIKELNTGETEDVRADVVVLATGFRDLGPGPHQERVPPLMEGIADSFVFDEDGYLDISADYLLTPMDADTPDLYLNGLCESSHGIGDAGSFSLLSLRAGVLLDRLRKRAR